LRFVLITSTAEVQSLSAAPESAVATEVSGLKLQIAKSGHAKCGRCWHHRADVGTHATHPELCERCVENIEGVGEVRHYA
jgi:isoleucyl-tRNA synthetase